MGDIEKGKVVGLRFSTVDYQALLGEAQRAGLPISTYLKLRLEHQKNQLALEQFMHELKERNDTIQREILFRTNLSLAFVDGKKGEEAKELAKRATDGFFAKLDGGE